MADSLTRDLAVARHARRLGGRLLGLALDRLAEPPPIWTVTQRNCGVACPPHLDGLLAVHADREAADGAGVRARARAERAMPALRVAREAGRLRETGYRLLCVKATPDSIAEWLAEAPDPTDREACAAYHRLLSAALAPYEVPSPLEGQPPTRHGERPDDVRFRIDCQAKKPGSTLLALHATAAFDAAQHDNWWRAKQRIRGSTRTTPSPGATLRALLDFFGLPDVAPTLKAPASLAEITPGRKRYICPITGREAYSTNAGRLGVPPLAPGERPRDCRLFARDARGRSMRWTRTQLKKAFPEVFSDPARETPEQLARRVRVLLGYPAAFAIELCPPVPHRVDPGAPAPIAEDAVPPALVEQLDPDADALPDLSPVESRAVTVALARADTELHYREVAALAALNDAEADGRIPAGATAAACAAEGMSPRTRQEALAVWRRLQALPALAAAFRDGMDYGKVRVLATAATPSTVDAWVRFARPRKRLVLEACANAARPGDVPPAVPDGLDPTLPIGTRVPERIHVDLEPAQQATLHRLRGWLAPLLGDRADDAAVFAAIAGWYVVARSEHKTPRDTIVYQRSAEARVPIERRRPEDAGPRAPDGALAGAFEGARPVPGGRCRHDTPHPASRTPFAGLPPAFAWASAPAARLAVEWPLPLQRSGKTHTPRPTREAIEDRDGFRCTATGCRHDLVIQYNHGVGRQYGQAADVELDQHVDGPCNEGHSLKQLFIVNRPDGGTWCWDDGDRRLGRTAPIARQLDAPLVEHLLALARQAIVAREAAGGAAPPSTSRPPPAADSRAA